MRINGWLYAIYKNVRFSFNRKRSENILCAPRLSLPLLQDRATWRSYSCFVTHMTPQIARKYIKAIVYLSYILADHKTSKYCNTCGKLFCKQNVRDTQPDQRRSEHIINGFCFFVIYLIIRRYTMTHFVCRYLWIILDMQVEECNCF